MVDKMRVRRRIAKASFVSILMTLACILVLIGVGDADTALNLNAGSGPVAMILSFLTVIVLSYMGIVHHNDIKEGHPLD